eukprot:TRINITY_DN8352_c1_g1_i1.p1 TRINITY_DN8352_c1_g1~~TRINITY_DN8352_c1_g1_i1.p1  ORF type:complete len:455 (+),score=101.71 TRINITY_DN8352_c1_g1_i1:76-1440(+)
MKINVDDDPDPKLKLPADPPISPPADDEHARAVRIRSYTTLTTGKDIQTQKNEKIASGACSGVSRSSDEDYAVGVEVVKFNELFHHCEITGKRPADKVFLKSGKAFCEEEAVKYYKAHKDDYIALCYEISDYDECFWNYEEDRFCTPDESEPYDDLLEAVFETKGSYLDEPITDKTLVITPLNSSETLLDGTIATTSMQGWRISNEDCHYVHVDKDYIVTCVLDGHGGARVAKFVEQCLRESVPKMLKAVREGGDLKERLETLFEEVDAMVEEGVKPDFSGAMGTTMNLLVIGKDGYTVANAGDSRTILCTDGGVVRLSEDHKPTSEQEQARVEKAGGRVSEGRVEGILAVSRALGDFDFKQAGSLPPSEQAVTAFPDVETHPRSPGDRFILQACDGIFDCFTDEELRSLVTEKLEKNIPPGEIVTALCDACLSPTITDSGIGTDNMSVHLIVF